MGGRGWIVPNLLSPEDCDELIQAGEDWGIHPDTKSRGRTSSRTNNYINEELSARLNQRLPEALLEAVEGTMPYSSVRGIHPNWRVARYAIGFPVLCNPLWAGRHQFDYHNHVSLLLLCLTTC